MMKRFDWRKLPKGRVHVLKLEIVTEAGNKACVTNAVNVGAETAKLIEQLFVRLANDQ